LFTDRSDWWLQQRPAVELEHRPGSADFDHRGLNGSFSQALFGRKKSLCRGKSQKMGCRRHPIPIPPGGSYKVAEAVFDAMVVFCGRFIEREAGSRRTSTRHA
jgi:hypothetical protein